MNLFNTPLWKNRKVDVRIDAINSMSETEAATALPEIASNDKDSGVRQLAIKKLRDLDLLATFSSDTDQAVAKAAKARISQLMCGAAGDDNLEVQHLQRFCRITKDSQLLETVVMTASDTTLRRHALNAALALQANHNALLQKVAIESDCAELRLHAVEQIDQVPALRQVIDGLRLKDKAASRLAQTQLDQIQLKAGDLETMHAHQLRLCESIETANEGMPKQSDVDELNSAWINLIKIAPSAASTDLTERFERGVRIAARLISPPVVAPPAEEPVEATEAASEPAAEATNEEPASKTAAAAPDTEALEAQQAEQTKLLRSAVQSASQVVEHGVEAAFKKVDTASKRLSQSISNAAELPAEQLAEAKTLAKKLNKLLQKQSKARESAIKTATEQLAALKAAVADNKSGPAGEAHKALVSALKTARSLRAGDDINAISNELSSVEPEYQTLSEAQHWSNNRARSELCEHAEKLSKSNKPPAELAKEIKTLQANWKKLNELEHSQGPRSMQGRFNASCRKAWEPCAKFFAEVDTQRKNDLEAVEGFLQQLLSTEASKLDFKVLLEKIDLGHRVERELRTYPAKRKGDLPQKIRNALKSYEKARDRVWAENAAAKQRLISLVNGLSQDEDIRKATTEVKRLQAEWKKIGPAKRKQNQALWEQFRAAADVLFARVKDQNNQHKAEQSQSGLFVEAQLEKLSALLSDSASSQVLKQKLSNIKRDTDESIAQAGKHPAVRKFNEGTAAIAKLISTRQRDESLEALAPLREAARSECVDASVDGVSAAHDAVLEIEIAAGIDSPAEDATRRMKLQLNRLSNQFGKNEGGKPSTVLAMAEAWYASHRIDLKTWETLSTRVDAAARASR